MREGNEFGPSAKSTRTQRSTTDDSLPPPISATHEYDVLSNLGCDMVRSNVNIFAVISGFQRYTLHQMYVRYLLTTFPPILGLKHWHADHINSVSPTV